MPLSTPSSVVRQIETLFDGGSVAGLTDRQLIERFGARRDAASEIAFAALVSRHGPMVLDICLQLLGNPHDADDAFQAVFLVLARKARSIGDPQLLANWLYGVALRTARNAHMQRARRRKNEEAAMTRHSRSDSGLLIDPSVSTPVQTVLAQEQAEALYSEIDRLPGPFRLAVVLCYFEGLTLDEAAKRLRCPAGTVRSRLARAYDKLRRGLIRRGVGMPAAGIAAVLAARTASACVSSALCESTARAAMNFAARRAAAGAISASAVGLAHHVLRSMLFQKLRLTLLTLLFAGAIVSGAGYVIRPLNGQARPAAGEPPSKPSRDPARTDFGLRTSASSVEPRAQSSREVSRAESRPPEIAQGQPAAANNNAQTPAPGWMFVVGRVLDPDGKPVKEATVDLIARPRAPWVAASVEADAFTLLGQSETDRDGRFRMESRRTASSRFFQLIALATAPGFGVGWADLNPDSEQPGGEIRLLPERAVRARLVEISGIPAASVEVRVRGLGRATETGTWDGVILNADPPEGLRTWPRPVKTDHQGRLILNRIGPDLLVSLTVRDLRYARQDLNLGQPGQAPSKEPTFALEPARIIEGRVLAADTGKPIANAVVSAATRLRNEYANGYFTAKFHADGDGRFQMNPIAGEKYTVGAFPTGSEPYLILQEELNWVKGAVKATHDIKLQRGVSIRGMVTEERTGRRLPGSSIQFIPMRDEDKVLSGWNAMVASQDDGSFQITVSPGKGHLLVFGPSPDYVLEEIGSHRLRGYRPGGIRYRSHKIVPYEVKLGDAPLEVAAPLRPGVTIKGQVEGPDDQTVTDAFILTTLRIEASNPFWRGDYKVPIRDGRFELHGLAPEAATRIYILDSLHQQGAAVEISGKQAGEDLTIRLQPCGQAKARFVGPDGSPVVKHSPHFEVVITQGPSPYSRREQDVANLSADVELMANVDRKHYWNGPLSNAEGRVLLPDLIPGALYHIVDFSTIGDQKKGAQVRKDFTVKPGETLDLGDILIEKPAMQ